MKPLLDEGSNGIRIVPSSEDEINIGDIITFKQNIDENNYLIVHRVIEKGEDLQGTYFITKGDNNSLNDGKVRFSEIKYLKTVQIFASGVMFFATILVIYGFFTELPTEQIERPLTRNSLYLILFGVSVHGLVSLIKNRKKNEK